MVGFSTVLVFLFGTFLAANAATDRVVCYHGTWAVYRPDNGKFNIEDIDPTLCDLLIYTFIGINEDGSIRILDSYYDVDLGAMTRFNALKQQSPSTKTSVAIGGWNEGSEKYSAVASDPAKRQRLISDAVNFLQTYGFDGFDLDWEYPGSRGGSEADKANFVALVREFREEFDKHGFLLTAAVGAVGATVDAAYDIAQVSQHLHYIHVMAYDLHGAWETVTGENAPLYPSSIDVTDVDRLLNVEASVKTWIGGGADPAKIILGLGLYGRGFTLADANNNGIGATAWSPSTAGPYTREAGILGYNEICEFQAGWTEVWNEEQQVPYAYNGNQWVGYDNIRSLEIKVDFAKSYGLGGVMVWSVETDDFKGICGPRYPLLNAIRNAVRA